MLKRGLTTSLFVLLCFTLVALLAADVLFYYKLHNDQEAMSVAFQKKIVDLRDRLNETEQELLDKIQEERTYHTEQRLSLEQKTDDTFKKLDAELDLETSLLRQDLDSQITSVSSNIENVRAQTQAELDGISNVVDDLEDLNEELQGRVSDLDLKSADFTDIIDDVVKSVVSVKTNLGQGSGVFFRSNGYIMTNKHVIDGSAYVQAVDFDGVTHTATVVSTSSTADLAILKIDVTGVKSLSFASMGNIGVSDRVIAVGNPLGLSFTVTEGIVSALNRHVDSTGIGYVQTDVPINPGNSGGPLVSVNKKIVGINTLGVIGSDGLGFAIPADVVSSFANSV